MKKVIYLLAPLFIVLTTFTVNAQSWWSDATETDAARLGGNRLITPDNYRLVAIDLEKVKAELAEAPRWFTPEAEPGAVEFTIPMPDGSSQTFQVVEAPVMSPGLAAKYPGMRSFAGKSRTDKTAYARFGYTHKGFHAMVLSGKHSTVFIDIYNSGQNLFHQVYYKKDYNGIPGNEFVCEVEAATVEAEGNTGAGSLLMGDCLLRNYRTAIACTGEYAQFHGGTVPDVMAEYNVAMTRVNGVYERDLTVHMELIDNTDELIFLDGATDPYTNGSGGTMLGENQNTIDEIIGFNNYDVGHVFSTGGGGVATLNAPCNSNKARGVTGLPSPVNDPFYIDYVSHEMGHQFGANHTQNNSCNRVNATAMEPGSASTIMGYAGICSPNVQNNSDDHFHAISIQEITNNIEFGSGGSCPEIINTGNAGPDVTIESPVYHLPVSTPFFLTAIASDADGDELTYCWEQMDNEVAEMPPLPTNDGGPAFRSNSPVPSPTRYFPNLPAVVDNMTPEWEVVPSVGRDMDFRCTVRDNVIGGGCASTIDVSLSFSENAGPFEVLTPNTPVTWLVGEEQMVTWDVANTDSAPVSCSEVDIYLSTDGGQAYPIVLATNVPNSGSATITVPLELTEEARVQVVCSDNIFYDISNENFTIEEPPTPSFLLAAAPSSLSQCNDVEASYELATTVIAGFDETLTFSVTGLPDSATATFSPTPAAAGETVTLTVSNLEDALPGTYTLEVEATSTSVTRLLSVSLELDTGVPSSVALVAPASGSQLIAPDSVLSWNAALLADEYLVEIATSPAFDSTVVETATVFNASYQPVQLEEGSIYYWRVTSTNLCGSTIPSGTYSFQTLKNDCREFINEDPGLVIPDDGTGMYSSILEIPDSLEIDDLNLSIDLAHTWVGDLSAILNSPSGTAVQLFDQPGVPASTFGCDDNNLLVSFDDEAESTAEDFENSCNGGNGYAIEGLFQPLEMLSSFNNENSAGAWTLDLFDSFNQDGGSLLSWSLEVCLEGAALKPAEQLLNLPLEVSVGESEAITSGLLTHTKEGFGPAELTYRIVQLPAHGYLVQSPGTDTLGIGATFTQADIDMGSLAYHHDSSITMTDLFVFDLVDPEGGWLSNQTFNFLIIQPNAISTLAIVSGAILCDGGTEGSINIYAAGGMPPYQYSLDGMAFQASSVFDSLPEGTYTFTVIDSDTLESETSPITLVAPGPVNGIATVVYDTLTVETTGGTPPYAYSLNGENYQDSNEFTGLENGTYEVVVQDANGCTFVTTAMVNIIQMASLDITGVDCPEDADGSISVTSVVGGIEPYTYSLNQGAAQSDPLFENLSGGLYDLAITDAEGYTFLIEDILVEAPDPLIIEPQLDGNNLTITAQGGTPPYQYSIDGGQTFIEEGVFPDLPNGSYDVVTVDANGCESTGTLFVNIITDVQVEVAPASCSDSEDGSINVTGVEGGEQPYTYSLNGGSIQSTSLFEGLPAGTYSVEVTDFNGNVFLVEDLVVTAPPPLVFEVMVAVGTIDILASGGSEPYQYSIDGGATFSSDSTFTGLENGDYEVLVMDASGCLSEVQTVTVVISSTGDLPFGWSVKLSPNPTYGELWLEATGLPDAAISWQLFSPLGQQLLFGIAPSPGGECRIPLPLDHLPAGTYWIWLRSEDGQRAVLPVVKQ